MRMDDEERKTQALDQLNRSLGPWVPPSWHTDIHDEHHKWRVRRGCSFITSRLNTLVVSFPEYGKLCLGSVGRLTQRLNERWLSENCSYSSLCYPSTSKPLDALVQLTACCQDLSGHLLPQSCSPWEPHGGPDPEAHGGKTSALKASVTVWLEGVRSQRWGLDLRQKTGPEGGGGWNFFLWLAGIKPLHLTSSVLETKSY